VPGASFPDLFAPIRPEAPFDYPTLAGSGQILFLVRELATGVLLRGQMLSLRPAEDAVVFLGSPWLTEAPLSSYGLSFDDFAIHDPAMDLLQLLQSQKMAAADLRKLTVRLQAQRAELSSAYDKLRREEEEHRKLAVIVENAEDAIFSETLDGRITTWNGGAARLHGYVAAEILGQPVGWLLPPDRIEEHVGLMERLVRGERVENLETRRRHRDGSERDVSLTISPLRDETGEIVGASTIARDITHRRRLEREVAQASHLEQQRIARELHDHLGAYLAGLAFRMKSLAEVLQRRAAPEADQARELVQLTNEAISQVRVFSHLLAPVEVATGGLAAGLPRLGAEVERLFGITCDVRMNPGLPVLSEEGAMHLYRIAQEASRNAVQHGGARRIEIRLQQDGGDFLVLTVRNDGRPWDPGAGAGQGLGLRIMHYRAGVLGGSLAIQSGADGLPEVRCRVPVPAPAAVTTPASS
jgi:PAS domain S-box-containing protein